MAGGINIGCHPTTLTSTPNFQSKEEKKLRVALILSFTSPIISSLLELETFSVRKYKKYSMEYNLA